MATFNKYYIKTCDTEKCLSVSTADKNIVGVIGGDSSVDYQWLLDPLPTLGQNMFTIRHRKTNRYIENEDDGTVKAVMTVGTNTYLTLNVGNDKTKIVNRQFKMPRYLLMSANIAISSENEKDGQNWKTMEA